MFGVLDTMFGWLFSFLFYFILGRVEDVVTWLLPIYMTVHVLRKKEVKKYNNYLSFWCLASLLFGIDWVSGFLLHNIVIFRILRVIFLIWIFIDHCHNSVFLVNQFLHPVIDEHRESIDAAFELINSNVENVSQQITDQAKGKIGAFVQTSQQEIMTGMLNFASQASKSVTSMVSNAEPAGDDKDSGNGKDKDSGKDGGSKSEGVSNPSETTVSSSDDSKDVEKET